MERGCWWDCRQQQKDYWGWKREREGKGDAMPPVNEWLNGDSEQCEFRGGASRLSVKRLDLLFHYSLCSFSASTTTLHRPPSTAEEWNNNKKEASPADWRVSESITPTKVRHSPQNKSKGRRKSGFTTPSRPFLVYVSVCRTARICYHWEAIAADGVASKRHSKVFQSLSLFGGVSLKEPLLLVCFSYSFYWIYIGNIFICWTTSADCPEWRSR